MDNGNKIIDSIEELKCIMANEACVLYGAGKVCRIVIVWASKNNFLIDKIFVTDSDKNPKNVLGIKVQDIDKIENVDRQKKLIVCVYEVKQHVILQGIDKEMFSSVFTITDELINRLLFDSADLDFEIKSSIQDLKKQFFLLKKSMTKFIPQPRLQYFIVNVCEHCNLNCKGCNHFSCLAEEYFLQVDGILKDLRQMHDLHGDVPRIGIMGGEPLLHPGITEILAGARSIFPRSELLLSTNGTLCNRMNNHFWNVCKEHDITIRFTKYPIGLDYDKLIKDIKEKGIKIDYFYGGEKVDSFHSLAIDTEGRQDPVASFCECEFGNQCVMLSEGKLYTCQLISNIKIFNEAFRTSLPVEKGDWIDIYHTSEEETLKRLSKPIPFCRFCNVRKRGTNTFQWGTTKKQISEWT